MQHAHGMRTHAMLPCLTAPTRTHAHARTPHAHACMHAACAHAAAKRSGFKHTSSVNADRCAACWSTPMGCRCAGRTTPRRCSPPSTCGQRWAPGGGASRQFKGLAMHAAAVLHLPATVRGGPRGGGASAVDRFSDAHGCSLPSSWDQRSARSSLAANWTRL